MIKHSLAFSVPLLLAVLGLPEMGVAAPSVSVVTTNGTPGAVVQVPIAFTTDTSCPAANFDLVYNPTFLTAGTPTGGNALADHVIVSSGSSGTLHVQIASFTDALLKNGVLMYVPFSVASNELSSIEPLTLTNVVLSSPADTQISPVNITNGSITFSIPLRFSPVVFTNNIAQFSLNGSPGTNYVIQTTSDLASPQWKSVLTNSPNSSGVLQFNDNAATIVPRRFYRAVQTN